MSTRQPGQTPIADAKGNLNPDRPPPPVRTHEELGACTASVGALVVRDPKDGRCTRRHVKRVVDELDVGLAGLELDGDRKRSMMARVGRGAKQEENDLSAASNVARFDFYRCWSQALLFK